VASPAVVVAAAEVVDGDCDKVGKRADLVILDRNLFEIPSAKISDIKVTMTVFDGRTAYRKPE
jgi:predicted amidohydrolase YtcJ